MKKILFIFSILAIAVACAPKLTTPEPTPVISDTAEVMTSEAAVGKTVYSTSCVKCHKAKVIDEYSKEQWAGILPKMIIKAKLDETQANQVTQYINWELEH